MINGKSIEIQIKKISHLWAGNKMRDLHKILTIICAGHSTYTFSLFLCPYLSLVLSCSIPIELGVIKTIYKCLHAANLVLFNEQSSACVINFFHIAAT